jgi:hypothetical protein
MKNQHGEWHIYQLNDCDWYVARTLEEAIACAIEFTGSSREDVLDGSHGTPCQLDEEALDRKQFTETDEFENEIATRPFREELRLRVEAGLSEPEQFATTEL